MTAEYLALWDKLARMAHWTFALPGVSVISLDKALEVNKLITHVGDNVEIKCDITGKPSPPIVWRRNDIDLSTISQDEIKVNIYIYRSSVVLSFVVQFVLKQDVVVVDRYSSTDLFT